MTTASALRRDPALTARFLDRAHDLLGPRGLTDDPDLLLPWLTDWRGRYTGRALAMASPASTAEVAALVQLCAEFGVPLVPQGGNSGMAGGATPDASGTAIILSLRRMNAIRTLSADDGQVICEAGVVLQSLHDAAEAAGMRFPLTLGGKGSATIGGLIATNAGGTQVLRHGTMRAQVLGLEAVLADGTVFDGLAVLKKDNRGFDLKQLLIGAEGTLGVVTAATLKLFPVMRSRATAMVGLHAPSAAIELHHAALEGEEGEVAPASDIAAGEKFLPALADEDVAGDDRLAAEFFHAEALADAVASVLDASLSFFMGHGGRCLEFDVRDFDAGEFLAVADRAVVAFAAAELEGDDFRGLALLDDLGGDLRALDQRSADLHAGVVGREEDLVECGGLAGLDVEQLDVNDVAGLDAELPAACLDDCVCHMVPLGKKLVGENRTPFSGRQGLSALLFAFA